MFKIDQFAAANEAAIEQFAYFAKLSLGNIEKFTELGLGAARESVSQATRHAQSLAGARDVNEAFAINSAAVEPALKRAYAYSRSAYETAAASSDEVKKVLEQNAAQLNKAAIAAAQSSYNNLASINKQIYDTVEQNVATAQAAATRTVKKTTKRK